jgi:hypothetical protein
LYRNEKKFEYDFEFFWTEIMTLNQDKSWFLGIVAFVALFAGSSFLTNELSDQPGTTQFSGLTDADIDMILSVKEEMQAAKIQTN